jgi:hypothetical protein
MKKTEAKKKQRLGMERRVFGYTAHIPERRLSKDRRIPKEKKRGPGRPRKDSKKVPKPKAGKIFVMTNVEVNIPTNGNGAGQKVSPVLRTYRRLSAQKALELSKWTECANYSRCMDWAAYQDLCFGCIDCPLCGLECFKAVIETHVIEPEMTGDRRLW